MKRRMLSLLLIAVMVLGMLTNTALAAPAESSGVYQIGTAEDLLWFAQKVNGGNTGIKGQLTANIDMSGIANWPGIGTSAKPFAGSFDGQNHTVTFKDASVGLFRYIRGGKNAVATVQNVIIAGSVKNSGLAQNAGFVHFTGCINRATVTSISNYAAGLVGNVVGVTEAGILKSDVVFTNCGNEASVSAGGGNVGGILGYSTTNTRLNGCYNTGNIHGYHHVGGLVGYLQKADGSCYISNSYNTGTVTGTSEVGGIIGYMMNGVSITNCYNAGAATYAIAGKRYDQTAKITNSYYLGTASAKCSPDYNATTRFDETTNEISTRATAKSASEMASAEFAQLLGGAFLQSCPTPVLSWETVVEHTGAICENCALGSTKKEIYDVSFQTHNGYTLIGADKATQGEAYTFTIAISEGYEKATNFTVKVNGEAVNAASNGKYTATPNTDYTFAAPDDYYDYTISVAVGGKEVTVTQNSDGSYTIPAEQVTGEIVVTATKTGKIFKVTLGTDMTGSATAQYGTDYVATIERDESYRYTVTVTIGGKDYTGYAASGKTYTIPGEDIIGEIVFTVQKEPTKPSNPTDPTEPTKPVTYHSVTFTGSGAGAAQGNATSVANGGTYTLTLKKQAGYNYQVSYKMGGKSAVSVSPNANGTYTIANVTASLEIIIEKSLNIDISVQEYLTLDRKTVFLILADALLGNGSLFTYDGNVMYYSKSYGAWAYLVITDQELDVNQVRSQVKISTQTDQEIMYSGDVDGNGSVDMNDARLIQDLYHAKYDTFDTITMMKYLRADVNGDRKVDIRDVAWVTWKILGK